MFKDASLLYFIIGIALQSYELAAGKLLWSYYSIHMCALMKKMLTEYINMHLNKIIILFGYLPHCLV